MSGRSKYKIEVVSEEVGNEFAPVWSWRVVDKETKEWAGAGYCSTEGEGESDAAIFLGQLTAQE